MTTKVMFRAWENGDVIALFPEEAATLKLDTCNSYMHIGQHGSSTLSLVVSKTRPAKEEEYSSLLEELEGIGYDDLRVVERVPSSALRKRSQ